MLYTKTTQKVSVSITMIAYIKTSLDEAIQYSYVPP